MMSVSINPDIPTTPHRKPLVSVVIPTHNRARLLQGAVDSVYAQEGAGELFDLEVLVVDDASSDNTSEVVRRWPSVRYIRLETHKYASGARNAGIQASTGNYIAFLDDDDLWLPHRLRVQLPILETRPEIGMVYGHGVVADEDGNVTIWPDSGGSGQVFEEFVTTTEDFINPNTVLTRREAFEKVGYFDETLPTREFYEMALRLAFHYQCFFFRGPISYGRYSTHGTWRRNIASGITEQILPVVIEKALRMLPEDPEHNRVRKRARVAVCATIAGQRWWAGGGLEAVRSHLLSSLRVNPWMVDCRPIVDQLARVARELARTSPTPISIVRGFWGEVRSATGRSNFMGWLKMQRLLAALLSETAVGMRDTSPRHAILVAVCAILHDPSPCYWETLATLLR